MNGTDKNILGNLSEREILILTYKKVEKMDEDIEKLQEGYIRHEVFVGQMKEKSKLQAVIWGAIAAAVISGVFELITRISH